MTTASFEAVQTESGVFEIARWSGETPVAVLLPGAMGGIRGYDLLGATLCRHGVPVAGMNPRGSGASTGDLEGITLRDLANDVIDVLTAVCAEPALLIGHAGGNRIARMAGTLRPDLVTGLVLLAAGGSVMPDDGAQDALAKLMTGQFSDKAERLRLTQMVMFAPGNPVPDDYFRVPDRSIAFARAFSSIMDATPVSDWWSGGTCPVLIIQGAQDRIAPPANGHLMMAEYPDRVRVVDLEDAGHALFVEKPSEISELIAGFARSIRDIG